MASSCCSIQLFPAQSRKRPRLRAGRKIHTCTTYLGSSRPAARLGHLRLLLKGGTTKGSLLAFRSCQRGCEMTRRADVEARELQDRPRWLRTKQRAAHAGWRRLRCATTTTTTSSSLGRTVLFSFLQAFAFRGFSSWCVPQGCGPGDDVTCCLLKKCWVDQGGCMWWCIHVDIQHTRRHSTYM